MKKVTLIFLSLFLFLTPFYSYGYSFTFNQYSGDYSVVINQYSGDHTVCVPSGSSEEQIKEYVAAAIVVYIADLKNN